MGRNSCVHGTDGCILHGLCTSLGTDELLRSNSNYQPIYQYIIITSMVTRWLSYPWRHYIQVLYLHRVSSSSVYMYGINNKIHLWTWLYCKDVLCLCGCVVVILLQVYYGIMLLVHPDSSVEVSILVTPLHIVPEWYFLGSYSVLKSIPGMVSGFLVMISCILVWCIYGELYSTSPLVGCMGYTGRYFVISILCALVFYSLSIGIQLPVGKYISYGRGYLV